MSRKDLNFLLLLIGIGYLLLRGKTMPGAATLAGVPVSEIEGGPTGLNNETLHNTGFDPGYVWERPGDPFYQP